MAASMAERVLGVGLLFIIGLTFFESPFDALMFACCLTSAAFVMAELGVWLGVVERE
jgi:hypothetical protein